MGCYATVDLGVPRTVTLVCEDERVNEIGEKGSDKSSASNKKRTSKGDLGCRERTVKLRHSHVVEETLSDGPFVGHDVLSKLLRLCV